jgi:HD-like signal output (HDOD) protein
MLERGCKAFEVEEKKFGFSHAEIGAYLLGIWGRAVYLGDLLANEPNDGAIAQHDQACLAALGLTEQMGEWRKTLKHAAAART